MDSKIIQQSFGTIASIILGIAAFISSKKTVNLDQFSDIGNLSNPFYFWNLTAFSLTILALFIMMRTGMSFVRSITEYTGITSLLILYLAFFHFVSFIGLGITIIIVMVFL